MVVETSLVLLLAQTCVAEISFHKDTTECTLMWEIAERRRGRQTLEQHIRKYNSYWKSTKQRNARLWIAELDGDEKPLHWPRYLPWKLHLKMWKRYKRAARSFLKTRKWRKQICKRAIDYGGPREYPRGEKVRIYCIKGARQWYFTHRKKKKDDGETWTTRTVTNAY